MKRVHKGKKALNEEIRNEKIAIALALKLVVDSGYRVEKI